MAGGSSVNLKVEVGGLKEALKTLNKIDPKLRRQITKDYKEAAKPLVDAIKNDIPQEAPVSGMERGRFSWGSPKDPRKFVDVKIDTRKARSRNLAVGAQYESMGVIKVRLRTAGLAVFDMAGKASQGKTPAGAALIAALNQRFGRPSRAAWPNANRHLPDVLEAFEPITRRVMQETNREL
jgi:hypothetical protein